jgi:acetamidase/formamidase
MESQFYCSQFTIEQVIHQIMARRRISRMDQHLLMSVLLSKNGISEIEKSMIEKVFDFLQRGLLRVVD